MLSIFKYLLKTFYNDVYIFLISVTLKIFVLLTGNWPDCEGIYGGQTNPDWNWSPDQILSGKNNLMRKIDTFSNKKKTANLTT